MKGIVHEIAKWGEFVKISHTVFALPFALASMLVAAKENRGWPGWRLFLLILGAMVTARTCAMTFNRIVDRHFDKLNPRTANRHLPAGSISLLSAKVLLAVSGAAFIFIAYHINTIC
ncbi:MAG: UbiA family prenyltransferase, partial [Verrucomicrobia bacterium]|nr:UbiA family prenyltransferase [Verrucomicrobiota bacterium]